MRNETFLKQIYFIVPIDKLIWPNFKMYLSKLHNQLLVSLFREESSHALFLHIDMRAFHSSLLYFLPEFWWISHKLEICLISFLLSTFKFPFLRFSLSTLIREMGVQLQKSYIRCFILGKSILEILADQSLAKLQHRFHLVKSDQRQCLFVCSNICAPGKS